jgi:RNA polymerase sigma-70 factor (ECF subfamily)
VAQPPSSEASFDAIFRAHLDYVWRVARVMVDDASADDIAQDVFLVARRRLHEAPVRSIRGWLYGITRNVARNHRRQRVRHLRAVARVPEPGPAPPPDAHYDRT